MVPCLEPERFFAGVPVGLAVFERVRGVLEAIGPLAIRVSKSQVGFRRARGFAYLWVPGRYLSNPGAEVVLSIALGRSVDSPRFKEVVHPSPAHWMHHLEVHAPNDIDEEVAEWLREAADRAG